MQPPCIQYFANSYTTPARPLSGVCRRCSHRLVPTSTREPKRQHTSKQRKRALPWQPCRVPTPCASCACMSMCEESRNQLTKLVSVFPCATTNSRQHTGDAALETSVLSGPQIYMSSSPNRVLASLKAPEDTPRSQSRSLTHRGFQLSPYPAPAEESRGGAGGGRKVFANTLLQRSDGIPNIEPAAAESTR